MSVEDITSKIKDKKAKDEFLRLYEKYSQSVNETSNGMIETNIADFIKLFSFYTEVIIPVLRKMSGIN